ncbi:MAG: carboxypeptidase regulatory-like domain-containing protein [Planctomycetota bacterium]
MRLIRAVGAFAVGVLIIAVLVGRPSDSPHGPGGDPGASSTPLPQTTAGRTPSEATPAARTAVDSPAARTDAPADETPQGFTGRLVDGRGAPVQGADVFLLESRRDDVLTALLVRQRGLSIPPVARAMSGDDGAFELRVRRVAPGGYEIHVLSAEHPDHVIPNLTGFRERLVDVGSVRLPDSCSISGSVTVLGSPGFPIADAIVTLRPAGIVPQFGTPPGREDGITVRTDAAGNFRFDHVAEGFVTVRAVAPGFAAVEQRALEVRPIHAEPKPLRFELPRGASISGDVRAQDGSPIPGARIEALHLASREPFQAIGRSRGDGTFEVLGLLEGPYLLRVEAQGFIGTERKPVASGARNERFELLEKGSVRLEVRGQGVPPPQFDALVRGYDAEHDALRAVQDAQVQPFLRKDLDGDGTCVLRGLDPGTYVIQVDAPGFARGFSAPFAVQAGETDVPVLVELGPGGTLVGRCFDERGGPLAGVTVETVAAFADESPLMEILGTAIPMRTTSAETQTGADGRFLLRTLAPGEYRLRFRATDRAGTSRSGILVVDGRQLDIGPVTLVRGARIEGTVRVDGALAGQIKISITSLEARPDQPTVHATAVSDDQGRFTLDRRLPPGRYQGQAARQTLPNPILQVMDYQKSRQEFGIAVGQESHELHFTLTSG